MAPTDANDGSGTLGVAPAPHAFHATTSKLWVMGAFHGSTSTQWVMIHVLIGLAPVLFASIWVFGLYAVEEIALCTASCLAAEAGFARMRRRRVPLGDASAAVTGVILALSLPWSTPWYVSVIASVVAIGLGKAAFGGLGNNLFNPAMVGRAFVMISFPVALGASAFQSAAEAVPDAVSGPTPLTLFRQTGEVTPLIDLFAGTTNGSLGETSAIAILIGGVYLCVVKSASWQIPAGVLGSALACGLIGQLVGEPGGLTALHHLAAGSLMYGAFFIATDPVSSPVSPRGRWIFGIGVGTLSMAIRAFSGYPAGVMFAVLLMNAATPLINRWTIPRPVGGPVPSKT